MKRFCIASRLPGFSPGSWVNYYIYITAKAVRRMSHERLEADGVLIDVPGEIRRVTQTPRPKAANEVYFKRRVKF